VSKGKRGGRQRQTASLAQHRQVRKTLKPPMMTIPNMVLVPWGRDVLPDMLWLCMFVHEYGDRGMYLAAKVMDCIDEVLDAEREDGNKLRPDKLIVTGQLTTLEQVPVEPRPTIIAELIERGLYEEAVPWVFARALSKYADVPGSWITDGWRGNEQIVAADLPEKFLAEIVNECGHGQSPGATRAKALVLRAFIHGDRLRFAMDPTKSGFAALPRYPDRVTEEERRVLEPTIRAAFGGVQSLIIGEPSSETGTDAAPLAWAKRFWRANWQLYGCRPLHADPPTPGEPDRTAIGEARTAWLAEFADLEQRFSAAATGTDPDLYNPDRAEVLMGIVARMLRALAVHIQYPTLWSGEHGSSLTRALIEARILLKWMIKREDPALYARFKDYGRGRLKLLKLHLEEYRDGLDDPSVDLDRHIEFLNAVVNQDTWEEFQEISIEGKFAGIDTRKMAEEVGLLTEYRLVFAPASASVHGEWAALDQYVLQRCTNPLHRGHRILEESSYMILGPGLVESALGQAEQLLDEYLGAVAAVAESTDDQPAKRAAEDVTALVPDA